MRLFIFKQSDGQSTFKTINITITVCHFYEEKNILTQPLLILLPFNVCNKIKLSISDVHMASELFDKLVHVCDMLQKNCNVLIK